MRIPVVAVRVAIYAVSLAGCTLIAFKTQGSFGALVGIAFGIGVGVFFDDTYLRLRARRRRDKS